MAIEATPIQSMPFQASPFNVRPMVPADVNAAADLRAQTWGSVEYWRSRIPLYLSGELTPQHALSPRAAFVAVVDAKFDEGVDDGKPDVGRGANKRGDEQKIFGFVAGHLTRRHECDGELEWIDVDRDHRSRGIAGKLLKVMGGWFLAQPALRICVDVDPKNAAARALYAKHGAVPLNPHWMVWEDVRTMGAREPGSFTPSESQR
jgi:GNAT superfamily N-acetyltransferase